MRLRLLLLALLTLSACAMPESRLRAGLVEAGLSEPLAACMAERMVDRLSLTQLRRLADLKYAGRAGNLAEFLHASARSAIRRSGQSRRPRPQFARQPGERRALNLSAGGRVSSVLYRPG